MFELPWEKTSDGISAVFKVPKIRTISPALSKKIAIIKMKEVEAISGYFKKSPVIFTPLGWILLDFSKRLEFFGLYRREEDLEPDEVELPSLCLRKASWSIDREYQAYKSTKEEYLKKYLFGEEQVRSSLFFVNSDDYPQILELTSDFLEKVKQGVKIEETDLPQTECEYVTYNMTDGQLDYNFSYSPSKFKSSELEMWGLRWREYFEKFVPTNQFTPDKSFRISYFPSFLNYLNEFGVEPRE